MAEQTVRIEDNGVAATAFRLMAVVQAASSQSAKDESSILDLYARCHEAARGHRTIRR